MNQYLISLIKIRPFCLVTKINPHEKIWLSISITPYLHFNIANPAVSKKNSLKNQRCRKYAGCLGNGKNVPIWKISAQNFYQAFESKQYNSTQRNNLPDWSAIGPKNIAGRTLALAFHPTNKDIVYLGSASGGLWKTMTGGKGASAWERVPTGFPILGVAAIAINPDNPKEIYIGTGEMYNSLETGPGVVYRTTRGTYGIGILKTEDGGKTWFKSLDWTYQNFTGIQDIAFHPNNKSIVFAATSEGLLKSEDSGNSWSTIHNLPMAVDIAINPKNTSIIYVTHGSLFHQSFSGVYRSLDGGHNFEILSGGLPSQYTGKTMIHLDPVNPDIIYASVADAFASIGLYKSQTRGDSWILLNDEDVAKWQGWYSHDIAIDPFNTEQMVYVGIDAWWSFKGGRVIVPKGTVEGWPSGKKIIAGKQEGPPGFVHSDIHRAYFHPFVENLVFLATDGGVFVSEVEAYLTNPEMGDYKPLSFMPIFLIPAAIPALPLGDYRIITLPFMMERNPGFGC